MNSNNDIPLKQIIESALSKIGGKEGRVLKMLCVVGYCGYFAYGNMIQHVFDYSFSQMPLSDYLLSHF